MGQEPVKPVRPFADVLEKQDFVFEGRCVGRAERGADEREVAPDQPAFDNTGTQDGNGLLLVAITNASGHRFRFRDGLEKGIFR